MGRRSKEKLSKDLHITNRYMRGAPKQQLSGKCKSKPGAITSVRLGPKTQEATCVDEDMEKKETSFTVGRNDHYGKQYGGASKN